MKAYKVIGVVMMGLVLTTASSQLWAGPESPAVKKVLLDKALYEDKCISCHGAEVFTRDDRKINSFKELKNQVRLCSMNAKTKWSDKQNMAVAYYLKKEFYKF
jgi:hypothetical protein